MAILVTGCATTPPPINTQFDEAAFRWSQEKGTAKIVGQAFLKTRAGDVKYGAGNTIRLLPVNDYTTEVRRRGTIAGERILPDPRMEQYVISAVADGSGNFEFTDVPAGNWYISALITWEVPTSNGLRKTGGVAYATVTVRDGEVKKAIVTRN